MYRGAGLMMKRGKGTMRFSSLIFAPVVVVCVLAGVLGVSGVPALADNACPNEQVRAESDVNPVTGVPFSMGLPECRAYEMVTPALKNGSPVGSNVGVLGFTSIGTVARVGLEGSTVLVESKGIWPGGEQPGNNDLDSLDNASEGVQYKITRGGSGWGFKPVMPAGLREFRSALLPNLADMSTDGVWGGVGSTPSEADITGGGNANFYLLEPGGAVAEIGPSNRSGAEVVPVGASVDLSHMLFSAGSLYEYVGTGHSGEGGGAPSLVGVDNAGVLISQCGIEAGAGYESEGSQLRPSDRSGEAEARSISADGSSVFFTANASCGGGGTGPAVNEVFARVGEPGPGVERGSAVTVNVAGTSECAIVAFDSCNVTEAVKYQGASTDGSKVFFTSEQPLVSGDTDNTSNLYECLLPGDSGGALTEVSPVDSCPDLVRVSVPVSSGGAEVQSVGAVSQDGSHVYFVAKGVLSGKNAEGSSPTPGLDNLYVWDEGRMAFIATLSSTAFMFGEAQATPDGDSLVFMSSADLLPGDTSAVSQVFLYEAQHEALRWVSEGQGGSEDGDTTTDPASLTSGTIKEVSSRIGEIAEDGRLGEGRRVISEDGSVVVFESSAALTGQVHGGKNNVYLWRDGELSLISDGTPAGTHHEAGGSTEGLVGIDASGRNVFFATEAPLVAQDSDELGDLYDARVDGGFPAPKVVECSGEGCQGGLSTPLAAVAPGSLSPPGGAGNLLPQPTLLSPIKPKPKSKPGPLTRSEKLARALKACAKDRAEKRRARCEVLARRRYGAKSNSRKAVKPVGGRGK